MDDNLKEKLNDDAKETADKARKLMSEEQFKECHKAIHVASVACAGIGAIPIPIADAIPMTALQVTMVLRLGKIFGKDMDKAAAKTMIATVAAPLIGRAASKALLTTIPIIGWAANAAIAAAVTEAVGWGIAVTFAADVRKASEQEDWISAFDENEDDEE